MDEKRLPSPIFEIDLGWKGDPIRPKSLGAFLEWWREEQDAWSWLREAPFSEQSGARLLRQAIDELNGVIDRRVDELRTSLENNDDDEHVNAVLNGLALDLNRAYEKRLLVHSHPLAQEIKRLGKNEDWDAVTAIAHHLGGENTNTNNGQHFYGAMLLAMARAGLLKGDRQEYELEMSELLTRQRLNAANIETELSNWESDFGTQLSNAKETEAKYRRIGAQQILRANQLVRQQRQQIVRDWETTKDKLITELTLQEPIRYWKRRRLATWVLAEAFYAAFAVMLIGMAWIVRTHGSDIAWGKIMPSLEKLSLGHVAVLLASVGVIVAMLRIPLRLGSSYLHLANDAGERVTMVKTYLALREKGHAGEGQMQTVIERLFLPAHDGLVKDDLVSVNIADHLVNSLRRQ